MLDSSYHSNLRSAPSALACHANGLASQISWLTLKIIDWNDFFAIELHENMHCGRDFREREKYFWAIGSDNNNPLKPYTVPEIDVNILNPFSILK